jgi:Subtilase family
VWHEHPHKAHDHLRDNPDHFHYGGPAYWVPDHVTPSGRRDEGEYHFAAGQLLIDESVDRDGDVRGILDEYELTPHEPPEEGALGQPLPPEERVPVPKVPGMRMLTMPLDDDRRIVIPEVVDRIRRLQPDAPWPQVAPNHVLLGASHRMFGPAYPAEPHRPAFERFPDEMVANGVTIAVLDTGNLDHESLPDFDPDEYDEPDEDGDEHLDYEAGHGTFIEGIIRRYAPAARVVHKRVLTSNGRVSDTSLADRLRECRSAHILNLSLGGYTHDNRGQYALPRMLGWLRRRNPTQVVVAAAGNDHTDRPFFPAAAKGVIAVAACDDSGDRAGYSNFGWWVDARAKGEHVSTFYRRPRSASGELLSRPFSDDDANFGGWAKWAGTSFAAPVVAAAIAAKMTELDTFNARAAARVLLDRAEDSFEPSLGVMIEPTDYTA